MRFLLPAPLFALLLAAACSPSGQTVGVNYEDPPEGDDNEANARPPVYIALGDSLSEGVGAGDESYAFVSLVAEGLGEGVALHNLGHSGDTSEDLFVHGHLGDAITELRDRNGDDDPGNDVRLVTLEIGGNDLLQLYFSLVVTGACPTVQESLAKAECVDALSVTLERFEASLGAALDRLLEADPALNLLLMTIYNPFSGGFQPVDELAELALEGDTAPFEEGLNDIIRRAAAERGVTLVDWYPLFRGKANEYIYSDLIHPNDEGYRVMAEAVLAAAR
jgi:lysophospholipase L1-like esterase